MNEQTVIIQEVVETRHIVERGEQGPPGGPPGGGSTDLTKITAAAVDLYTVVRATATGTVSEADVTDASHATTILGVAIQSAAIGSSVNIRTRGEITDSGWTWTLGAALYLGQSGALTHTVPTSGASGYLLYVGVALTATTILVNLEQPIYL